MMQEAARILVVEDEAGSRLTLCGILDDAGYEVTGAEKGTEALEVIKDGNFNVIITDIRLPDVGGMSVLELAKEVNPDIAVIIMTGYASIETAVNAVNEGAYAYFLKPVNMDEMKTAIVNALRQQMLSRENKRLVDDLQRSNKLLFEANRQLRAATEAKSIFLAHMSHELRTPLNAIIGFSDVLLGSVAGKINNKQRQCLEDILSSGKHLLSLINDVLDLSKVEAGKMDIKPERLRLADVVDDAITTVKPMLDDSRHELAISIAEDLPPIYGDRNRLKQILLNLLSNAIKFTPDGGKLCLEISRKGHFCQVSMVDNGIGIRKEDQTCIFEPFTQLDTLPGERKQGTGLGLALSKQLIELLGGKIWVESEYGKESRFSFTIPLSEKEAASKE
ncbi:MAG: hybrid sensor histidine kinase/response regulator [Deltaproteobacteria bacterium]|nr:hybrid sensor histidine kinase/response regulator [Deltaproteobacteria bacterium]